jgi:hypothetical protein
LDQPHPLQFTGAWAPSGEQQSHGLVVRHAANQLGHAAVQRDASHARLGQPKLRVLGGHHDVRRDEDLARFARARTRRAIGPVPDQLG